MSVSAVEAATFDSENLSEGFFEKWPTDARYDHVEVLRFKPDSTITDGQANFHCNRQHGRRLYQPNDAVLEAKVLLSREDGEDIPSTLNVGPVNNVLHSLFSSCRIMLEDVLVNPSPENYQYKAYMMNLLNYGVEAEYSHMATFGWYRDTKGEFDAADNGNQGFADRNALFRRDHSKAFDSYHNEPVTFIGKLITDLQISQPGIPPGIEITVDLKYTPHEFRLMSDKADPVKYNLDIVSLNLLMPVATLTEEIYTSFHRLFAKNDVRLHYKRSEVKVIHVAEGRMDGGADHLFVNTLPPSKIVIGIVRTKAFRGDMHKNPFCFQRKWGVGADESYIEDMYLLFNGNRLDQMTSRATRDDATAVYYRFQYFLGMANTPRGNYVSYEDFLNGNYFTIYDLSTSSKADVDYIVPAVRIGNLSLQVQFSRPVPEDLTIIVFSEYPSLLQISQQGKVKMTFLNA